MHLIRKLELLNWFAFFQTCHIFIHEDYLAFSSIVAIPENDDVVDWSRNHHVVAWDVKTCHITFMARSLFAPLNNFRSFQIARTEQESNLSIPECGCHPEVCLFCEKAEVRNFMLQVDFRFLSLIIEQGSRVSVVNLHRSSFKSDYKVFVIIW